MQTPDNLSGFYPNAQVIQLIGADQFTGNPKEGDAPSLTIKTASDGKSI